MDTYEWFTVNYHIALLCVQTVLLHVHVCISNIIGIDIILLRIDMIGLHLAVVFF